MRTTGVLHSPMAFSAWMMRRSRPVASPTGQTTASIDAEEKAARQIWELKTVLRSKATSTDFWPILVEGMVEITGAQSSYVSRRLQEDEYSGECKPVVYSGDGDPCTTPNCTGLQRMLAIASCLTDGRGKTKLFRLSEYILESALVQDQVLLIPHSLTQNHPGMMNVPALDTTHYEAMLSVPLSHETESMIQMGLLWTKEGLKTKPPLSWAFTTMILHSLEDLVHSHLLNELVAEQATTTPGSGELPSDANVPHCCKMSFKPYARNVSHELRTPMQGVVGILDLMQSSLQELERVNIRKKRTDIVQTLMKNIEVAHG